MNDDLLDCYTQLDYENDYQEAFILDTFDPDLYSIQCGDFEE